MARSRGSAKGAAAKRKRKRAKPKRPRCEARTAAGRRCTNPAKKGARVCGTHGGKIGAPTKFTADNRLKILQLTQQANFKNEVCKGVGIDRTSLAHWLERGEADLHAGVESEFSDFFLAYGKAEAEGEILLVSRLQRASQGGDVRATLEILKRRYRERWGDRVQAEHSGPGGGPIESKASIDVDNLPLERRRQLLALLEEANTTKGGSA